MGIMNAPDQTTGGNMDTLSWSEVDDLRAQLGPIERARFDAELRELASSDEDPGSAFEDLLARWRGVVRPTRMRSYRLGFAPGWMARLTGAH
jgi:hypothetical protein